ncbi:hypothetical protein EOI86_00200 [Hwanghaeella grinnelliae]|uniref:Probable chemoreceptor glutamine deamidase CheD n=2 Tax=Hwanghaeella grinnelliae TaxID=2500179 RepID=A0A3S2VSS0_9PROT|nr:hypothetical protein EOI86_00200 [Hwanghaeella grinnelliae]
MGQPSAKRYFDHRFNRHAVHVGAGEVYVSAAPNEMIVTLLGSCVAACIHDRHSGIGGLNHFMLPDKGGDKIDGDMMRYGAYAMEKLINEMLKRGAAKNRLEFKVFGGAKMIGSTGSIGQRNVDFVERFLALEHFAVDARHVGGMHARRVHFFPTTGTVKMKVIADANAVELVREERQLADGMDRVAVGGDAELF